MYSAACKLKTYGPDELLGTKLRALYQRRKGRDLFDLWLGLTDGQANPAKVVRIFHRYMKDEGLKVSQREYRENLVRKMTTKSFLADTENLLRPGIAYQPREAFQLVNQKVLQLL